MSEFRGFSGEFRDSPSCSVTVLLVLSLLLVSVSCGSRDSSQIEREKALRERVEEQSKRVEKDLVKAKEESQRVREEVIRAKQEKSLLIGLGLAGVVIALVLGTAMGSKARRDAKNLREHSGKKADSPKERETNREKGGDPIQGKSGTTEGGDPIDGKPEPK